MPFKSQAQRGLAHAVASGKLKSDTMSKSAAKRLIADDPGGKLPKRLNKAVKKNLRPLRSGEFRQNPDGSRSTEITVTVPDQFGNWMLVPSLWKGRGFVEMDDDAARQAALEYETRTGSIFPRFETPQQASQFAQMRSALGGASKNPLAVPSLLNSALRKRKKAS